MKIVYSFNKKGYEAEYWQREIAAASNENFQFIPFNHDPYLDVNLYLRAQLLDNLYFQHNSGLFRMYSDLEQLIEEKEANALIVDNCFPYHPEFLKRLDLYKAMRTTDGPVIAYDRDFAYLHAYDHVLYHTPAYSRELTMEEKLRYCGAKRFDFFPLGLFDIAHDPSKKKNDLFTQVRDIDIIFIGSQQINKMPLLAKLKKEFGARCHIYGLTSLKRNLYFNIKFGFPGWVRPISFEQYVPLYQRAKIGFNMHNRGKYTIGSFRLFDLPGNGVMQISDGGEYLSQFFNVGKEIVGYEKDDELIEKIHYYLDSPQERLEIIRNGYHRVSEDYRFGHCLRKAAECLRRGMAQNSCD